MALTALLTAGIVFRPAVALAGAQIYEPLADSVRAALSNAISDEAPPHLEFRNPQAGRRWLDTMSGRLKKFVPDHFMRIALLKSVQYEATLAGLNPQLVLGVINVESDFRKYAVSSAGALGYMQVMPFWVRLIGRPSDNLFHLRTNLRYGCVILRFYLDQEHGNYFLALGRYNGTMGQPEYPDAVYDAWKGRWKYSGPTN